MNKYSVVIVPVEAKDICKVPYSAVLDNKCNLLDKFNKSGLVCGCVSVWVCACETKTEHKPILLRTMIN